MEFHFGAQVQPNNGERLGELTRVVYDLETRAIEFLVAQSAHMGQREVMIPLQSIETTDDSTVQVTLSEDEFEALESYSSSRNIAPPPDRDFADIDEDDEITPGSEAPPVGAATGIESIAFVPIVQEDVYIPTGDGVIDRATEVWATDRSLGHVHAVMIDDSTGSIGRILVRYGTIFTHTISVPGDRIESLRLDTIVLNVESAEVDEHAS